MLLKNTLALVLAEIVKPLITLVFIGYISRILGVEMFGQFGTILTFVLVFEHLAAMGMAGMIIRDVAVDRKQAGEFLTTATAISLVASLVVLFVIGLILQIFSYTPEINQAIGLLAFSIFFYVATGHIQSLLEGFQRMELKSALSITESLLKAILGILALNAGYGLMGLIGAIVIVRAIVFGLAIFYAGLVGIRPVWNVAWRQYFKMLRKTLTFFFISILSSIYWCTDVLMLSKLGNMSDVGTYVAAYRPMELMLNLSLCYITALYPMMSIMFAESAISFRRQCTVAIKYLFILSFPTAVGTTILADRVINLIYGKEYTESILCLQILIWVICFFPSALVFAKALASSHNQSKDLMANLWGVLLNILLNAILIPRYDFLGAAIATLCSMSVFMIIQYSYVRSSLFKVEFLSQLLKPFLAGCLMGIGTWSLRDSHLLLVIPVSICIYVLSLFMIKTFDQNETRAIRSCWPNMRRFSINGK